MRVQVGPQIELPKAVFPSWRTFGNGNVQRAGSEAVWDAFGGRPGHRKLAFRVGVVQFPAYSPIWRWSAFGERSGVLLGAGLGVHLVQNRLPWGFREHLENETRKMSVHGTLLTAKTLPQNPPRRGSDWAPGVLKTLPGPPPNVKPLRGNLCFVNIVPQFLSLVKKCFSYNSFRS